MPIIFGEFGDQSESGERIGEVQKDRAHHTQVECSDILRYV